MNRLQEHLRKPVGGHRWVEAYEKIYSNEPDAIAARAYPASNSLPASGPIANGSAS
jgi:hypothetical protein